MQSSQDLLVVAQGDKIWKGCFYGRLSREDGDKEESDSIVNQRALVHDYVSANMPDVNITAEFIDGGYSGTSFERSFFQMKCRIEKGLIKKTGQSKTYLWRDKSIQLMTTNPMYIGHMAQGRQKQALCKNQKVKLTPKSEWIVVDNTHEAIIDRATFDLSQEMRLRNTSKFYRNYDRTKHIKT